MASQREAQRAIELHEKELSRLPNVVGLGVAPIEQPGPPQYQVAVYVSKKVSDRELEHDKVIPESLKLPTREGSTTVPTKVIESGEFTFE